MPLLPKYRDERRCNTCKSPVEQLMRDNGTYEVPTTVQYKDMVLTHLCPTCNRTIPKEHTYKDSLANERGCHDDPMSERWS